MHNAGLGAMQPVILRSPNQDLHLYLSSFGAKSVVYQCYVLSGVKAVLFFLFLWAFCISRLANSGFSDSKRHPCNKNLWSFWDGSFYIETFEDQSLERNIQLTSGHGDVHHHVSHVCQLNSECVSVSGKMEGIKLSAEKFLRTTYLWMSPEGRRL